MKMKIVWALIGFITLAAQVKASPVQRMSYLNSPNRFVAVNGLKFAYRITGIPKGIPLVLLQHFRGTMDNWDPAFIDALAENREVIVFDNKGVGLSEGETPDNFKDMGDDAASFIKNLSLKKVDVLGFSIGGCIAQELTSNHPELVRKLILAATAPKGGQFMNHRDPHVISIVTEAQIQDAGYLIIFFELSASSQRLGNLFLNRRAQRKANFDRLSNAQTLKAHVTARQAWGEELDTTYAYLKKIKQPVLVANGNHDIMMFTINSYTLFEQLPNAHLILYPDSGHGFLFQYPEQFAKQVNTFLEHGL